MALDFSIISSTLSCMGAVLSPFTKEMGPSNEGGGQYSGSYQLDSIATGNRSKRTTRQLAADVTILRKDVYPHTATISHNTPSNRQSIESNNSKRGIIKKEIQWEISRDSSS